MIIIPDDSKANHMIDSYPDKPDEEDYYEINVINTIKITDKDLDDWWLEYEQESKGEGFSKYFKSKIAEKEKK